MEGRLMPLALLVKHFIKEGANATLNNIQVTAKVNSNSKFINGSQKIIIIQLGSGCLIADKGIR